MEARAGVVCHTEPVKFLRWVGNSFIVVGATLLFFVVYELVGTSLVTDHHQEALASEFDSELLKPPPRAGTPSPSPTPSAARSIRRGGPKPIARLIIPKIGVNKIVVEGTTLSALAFGPGHYSGTPMPWQMGPTGIACHRTGWGSPCINLDRLRTGDQIILETKQGCAKPPCRFVYAVTRQKIVEPGDVHVLSGDPNSRAARRLTLTTCTPKYTSLRRLIVWADLVSGPKVIT